MKKEDFYVEDRYPSLKERVAAVGKKDGDRTGPVVSSKLLALRKGEENTRRPETSVAKPNSVLTL